MKKLLLIASLAFFGALNLNAQCTPDASLTSSGIYPDSATNFIGGCVGQPYEQIIQNVVPADTIVPIGGLPFPATIVSIDLNTVSGLPPGITYNCNPTSCSFLGGQTGCAVISGTCNTPGTYNLVFELTANATVGIIVPVPQSQDFTLTYYKIVIGACAASIDENTTSMFKLYPNPAYSKVVIDGLKGQNNITLTNAEGKIVKTYDMFEGTSLEMNLEGLNNGLYFVTVNHDKGTEVLKLIKE